MKIKEKGINKDDLKYFGIGACNKVLEQEYEEGKNMLYSVYTTRA